MSVPVSTTLYNSKLNAHLRVQLVYPIDCCWAPTTCRTEERLKFAALKVYSQMRKKYASLHFINFFFQFHSLRILRCFVSWISVTFHIIIGIFFVLVISEITISSSPSLRTHPLVLINLPSRWIEEFCIRILIVGVLQHRSFFYVQLLVSEQPHHFAQIYRLDSTKEDHWTLLISSFSSTFSPPTRSYYQLVSRFSQTRPSTRRSQITASTNGGTF